jgi:hypothetical protein
VIRRAIIGALERALGLRALRRDCPELLNGRLAAQAVDCAVREESASHEV